jgi:hypothetical protein
MKKRVLVAEDDANVAFLIKDGLCDLGASSKLKQFPPAKKHSNALTKANGIWW